MSHHKLKYLICIGTSTGGPKALQTILPHLPRREDTAILVVQHMPPGFTRSLAKRLDQLSDYIVKEGEQDEPVVGGTVYIAPGGYHMGIEQRGDQLNVKLSQDEPRKGHRPAVDVLFESMVKAKQKLICVILTGMGRDGCEGLKYLKQQRHVYAIAEAESTCVVYGMPRAIVEADLADCEVPLEQIPDAIIKTMSALGG